MVTAKEQSHILSHNSLVSHLHWYHWLVIACSLFLTFSAWYISSQQVQQKMAAQFQFQSEQIVALVKERMEKYEEALWAGAAALNTMPTKATRENWRVFSSSLNIASRFPGINGIGVIHYVPPEDLEEYLDWQRQSMPNYHIHPAHKLNEFWPITYIEPQLINLKAVGLDMAHEQNRFTAAKKARDTRSAQITAPITLVQDAKKTPGFLFYVPWYKYSLTSDKRVSQQKEFLGLVYAPFITSKLMGGTLSNRNRQVNFSIYDENSALYSELSTQSEDFDANPLFTKEVIIDIYGRPWKFLIQSSLLFRDQQSQNQPLIILIVGLFIDTLLFVLFVVLARSNQRAITYAEEVSENLKEQKYTLEQTHQRLSSAMNAMQDGLIVIDTQGTILECNESTQQMLGYENGQLNGQSVNLIMPMADARQHDSHLKHSLMQKGATSIIGKNRVLYALHSTGKKIPIQLRVSKGYTDKGMFYTGIIHDLTEITESKQRADDVDSLLKAAVHATSAGFLLVDSQYQLVEVNEAFASWLGYSPEEITKTSVSELFSQQDKQAITELLRTMFEGKTETTTQEIQYKHRNGSSVWGVMTAGVVEQKKSMITYIVMQVIDINTQKNLTKNLEKRNLALEEANRELDQFAFVASHDLKAPLRGISQLAQWIEDDLSDKLDEQTTEYMKLLHSRIHRLERLLDDLLSYSRAGRKDGDFHKITIGHIVKETFNLLSPPDGFHLVCDDQTNEINTLVTPLELIIRNLMSNAIKHHDKSIGTITIQIKNKNNAYEISVEDDGPGIPPEHHDRVFGIFHTLKPRDQVEGSGIGLSIIKKVLDRYNCEYSLHSDGKRGMCFRFTWPNEQQLRDYLND